MGYIKNTIEKHPKLWEVCKFLLTGGLATAIDFAVMSLVLYCFAPRMYSYSILKVFFGRETPSLVATIAGTCAGFLSGLLLSYFLSVLFVFTNNENSAKKAKTTEGFLLFSLFAAIGFSVHIAGMYVGYYIFSINEWIIKILLTAAILIFNYTSRKYLLFKESK